MILKKKKIVRIVNLFMKKMKGVKKSQCLGSTNTLSKHLVVISFMTYA